MHQDDHVKGLLITGGGVLAITPDSLLVRLIDADEWTLLFWRGVLTGVAMLLVLVALQRRKLISHIRDIGPEGLAYAVLFTASTILFILSLKRTSVANTLFIVSTSPVFAALMARFILGEAVSRRIWATIVLALVGIAVIARGSLGSGSSVPLGDAAALGVAICMASAFTLARRRRRSSMVPAMMVSAFLSATIAWPLATPALVAGDNLVYLALMGLVVLPVSTWALALGPRYLPAPEVGLMLLLEAVIAPLWVWWVIGETPATASLVGGTIVLATLAIFNLLALRRVG